MRTTSELKNLRLVFLQAHLLDLNSLNDVYHHFDASAVLLCPFFV